jgi:hypothetical protein
VAGHCMELGRYCITSLGWHSNFPSLDRSVEKFTATVLPVLLMTPLCRHFHCPSCGTSADRQTDRQTLTLKVILSSSLLKVVYCVPSRTVSRHYTSAVSWVPAKTRGERDFLLAVRLLGCDTVWSGGNAADIVKECTAAVFRAELLIFCTEDGSSGFLWDVCNY